MRSIRYSRGSTPRTSRSRRPSGNPTASSASSGASRPNPTRNHPSGETRTGPPSNSTAEPGATCPRNSPPCVRGPSRRTPVSCAATADSDSSGLVEGVIRIESGPPGSVTCPVVAPNDSRLGGRSTCGCRFRAILGRHRGDPGARRRRVAPSLVPFRDRRRARMRDGDGTGRCRAPRPPVPRPRTNRHAVVARPRPLLPGYPAGYLGRCQWAGRGRNSRAAAGEGRNGKAGRVPGEPPVD